MMQNLHLFTLSDSDFYSGGNRPDLKLRMSDAKLQSLESGERVTHFGVVGQALAVMNGLPILTARDVAILEILLDLSPVKGLTGAELIERLRKVKGYELSQSVLTTHLREKLELYGVENQPGLGYRIYPSLRSFLRAILNAT